MAASTDPNVPDATAAPDAASVRDVPTVSVAIPGGTNVPAAVSAATNIPAPSLPTGRNNRGCESPLSVSFA